MTTRTSCPAHNKSGMWKPPHVWITVYVLICQIWRTMFLLLAGLKILLKYAGGGGGLLWMTNALVISFSGAISTCLGHLLCLYCIHNIIITNFLKSLFKKSNFLNFLKSLQKFCGLFQEIKCPCKFIFGATFTTFGKITECPGLFWAVVVGTYLCWHSAYLCEYCFPIWPYKHDQETVIE